ncbi:FmdB family zinc ribbon protein [Leptolyngbya sp. AN03gr2]|uniref:FmdB family zinc ribbon protein n=1 Tax=unclassified Leptolyngbya TaxID=2650499 RepID=UPI003D313327
MPLYEFKCDDCGVFDVWRSMSESSNAASCPECNEPGKRIFTPLPMLSGSLRLKQEIREPQLVKRDREPKAPQVQHHSGSRPWMIGH